MGDVCGMKFDKYGRRIRASASAEVQNSLDPETVQRLQSLGIEIGAVEIFADMIPEESLSDLLEIIGKLVRLQK
jgi:hypothetical protein